MNGYIEQMLQIFDGAVWDGNLIGKRHRDELYKNGLIDRVMGWNIITKKGVKYVISLGLRKP